MFTFDDNNKMNGTMDSWDESIMKCEAFEERTF